jgi:hypothetical protein
MVLRELKLTLIISCTCSESCEKLTTHPVSGIVPLYGSKTLYDPILHSFIVSTIVVKIVLLFVFDLLAYFEGCFMSTCSDNFSKLMTLNHQQLKAEKFCDRCDYCNLF